MLRRCRGSGSEERSASGGEPLPAGPLRAVRGYARAYRPGHRSRGAGHYVRRSGELLPLGRVAGRRNGRGADGRPGRPVSGLSSGCRIAVRLQGLAMCRRFGVVQIGTMPAAGDYAVEAIGVRALLDRYVACETVDVLRPVPRIVAFDELAPDMCGCLVQIEDLTPLPSEEDPTDWNGKVIGCSRTGPETGSPPIRAPMPGMRLRKFRRGRLRWSAFCSTAMPGRSENPI